MKFSRRDFLATTALTSAAMVTGIPTAAQEEKGQAEHTTKTPSKFHLNRPWRPCILQ